MRHESLDILGSLNVDQRKRARSNIIALILGTDLQQHFEILCRFKGRFLDPVKADAPTHDDNGGVLLQMQIALKVGVFWRDATLQSCVTSVFCVRVWIRLRTFPTPPSRGNSIWSGPSAA
jgi:hypothetical protein